MRKESGVANNGGIHLKTKHPPPEMNTHCSTRQLPRALWASSLLLAFTVASPLLAQTTYTAVDLTPAGSGVASATSAGQAAGLTGATPNAFTGRATLWTGNGAVDLHPDFLTGPTASSSAVNGFSGNLQVGYGSGATTSNRYAPIAWRDTAASARLLTIPFTNAGGQATATDGKQIVGYALGLNRDGTTLGAYHGLIWDATTGFPTDIGTDINLRGVGGGIQVGTDKNGTASLWRGTKTGTSLHPKNAVVSIASATDGVRQVGYAGFDIRVRVEAVGGKKDKRYNYAHVWTGTAASAVNIHPYASSFDGSALDSSYATSVSGPWIAGYATLSTGLTNSIGLARAIVWDGSFQATDLHAFVPADFTASVAYGVDAEGNVVGTMTKADGTRHAVMWIPNP